MGTRGKLNVVEADSWHGNYVEERESRLAGHYGESWNSLGQFPPQR